MEYINNLIKDESIFKYIVISVSFILIFLALTFTSNQIFKKARVRSLRTDNKLSYFILKLFRIPTIWLIFAILLNIFSNALSINPEVYIALQKAGQILLIASIGWLSIQGIRAIFKYLESKLDITQSDNLAARKKLTQLNMIEKVLIVTIVVIFVAIALMTFDAIRGLGVSLLASAGVVGIVIGLAAQRSVGQILSGVQIALTQPIRIDDIVVIDGELGNIEEVNITYSVVKLWDERRLVVPNDNLLNNPFQNWTRTNSNILGTVMLYVSYDLPLAPLRKKLEEIVSNNSKWDGRVQNIQVTDSKEWYKELRVLVSSSSSSVNWDLRVEIREQLIDFINEHYPGSFAKISSINNTKDNSMV